MSKYGWWAEDSYNKGLKLQRKARKKYKRGKGFQSEQIKISNEKLKKVKK